MHSPPVLPRLLPLLLLLGGGAGIATSPAPPAATARAAASPQVHAFFYLWYGTPEHDGRWLHWDHSVLPHWQASVRARYPEGVRFVPPADIHAPFYPARGLYSSSDPATLVSQFQQMAAAGIDVAVVSWWGRPSVSSGDSQGVVTDAATERVLAAAAACDCGLRIAFHMEPYPGRNISSFVADVAYIQAKYVAGPHGAAVARDPATAALPVLYVYDSYHLPPEEWARALTAGGDLSLRGSPADAYFIGLWLEAGHGVQLAAGGFDAGYTYFAATGFSYGSTPQYWRAMAASAAAAGLQLVPSVGPGYDDSRIRPWNAGTTRARGEGGRYYRDMWQAALALRPAIVSISTWNEWGEGTQIEPAVPAVVDVAALAPAGRALNASMRAALGLSDAYKDYGAGGPELYLRLTRVFAAHLKAGGGGGGALEAALDAAAAGAEAQAEAPQQEL